MKHLALALLLACLATFVQAAPRALPAEEAYHVSARALDDKTLAVDIRIEEGYYLYRNKIRFATTTPGVTLGAARMPAGEDHHDPYFGTQVVYRGAATIQLPIEAPAGKPLQFVATVQGCADAGICHPPTEFPLEVTPAAVSAPSDGDAQTNWRDKLGRNSAGARQDRPAAVDLPAAVSAPVLLASKASAPPAPSAGVPGTTQASAVAPATSSASAPLASAASVPTVASAPLQATDGAVLEDDSSRITRLLKGGNLLLIVASFFGLGLLLSFTPCTLPMVNIVSAIIVGHGHHISRGRAFVLSAAYVLGMAVTYTAAGVLAGFSGTLLSTAMQSPWVLGPFAAVFVVLALAMFGAFELQLPSRWQHKISASANKHGGAPWPLAIMGMLSALIVGPCVAPPLAGALLYISQTHDARLGGLGLFFLALGMGTPLLLVGVAARSLLPKPGPWMEMVNRFFGLLLLATALWLVTPVVPAIVPMIGWAALLVIAGVLLRALDPLPAEAHTGLRLFKALGILALLFGAAIFIGALAGSRNPLQPLASLQASRVAAAGPVAPQFVRVKTVAELDRALAQSSKPVMLDFYADWCVSCKEMEHVTFQDAQVSPQMAQLTLLQVDVTQNTPEDRALLARFGLFAPPGILFFTPPGKEIEGARVIGFQAAERFAQGLRAVLARTDA